MQKPITLRLVHACAGARETFERPSAVGRVWSFDKRRATTGPNGGASVHLTRPLRVGRSVKRARERKREKEREREERERERNPQLAKL